MEWSDVGRVIGKAAPVLGSILVGNIPGAIAGAASLVSSELGCEPTPESVNAAIQADPQALVKLKELEVRKLEILTQYNVQVAQAQTAQFQAESQRIGQAQSREITLAQAGHKASWGTSVVSVIVTVMFGVMLYVVVGQSGPVSEAALLLLGTLATGFGAVLNYFLGSSIGSRAKDEAAYQLQVQQRGSSPELDALYQRLLAQARGERP